MLQVHSFKTGETILAYPDSPEYGRIIVATISDEITADGWFRETTRVAFVKGKIEQLERRFGSLNKGDVFNDNLTVVKKESTTPFYEGQDPKVKPAYTGKDGVEHAEEPILHNGAPVYMQFEVAPVGTADQLIGAESPVVETADHADLA